MYDGELDLHRRIMDIHSSDIVALSVSRPLCLIAAACDDGAVFVWDFQVRCWRLCLLIYHNRYLCSWNDQLLFWLQTCAPLARLMRHSAPVRGMTFVDDFPILVTADVAGTMVVWYGAQLSSRFLITVRFFACCRR